MATLTELQGYESDLLRAIGDPTKTVFFDHFRLENRPMAEIQAALDQVRREISKINIGDAPKVKRLMPVSSRGRDGY